MYVLELNDSDLRLLKDGEIAVSSPGYAMVDGNQLLLGREAFQQSRLRPLNCYSDYWHALSETPLRRPTRHYRHNADLAFAHLQYILEQGGRPEQVMIAVPGDMSRDQLALLLGLVSASRFKAAGLIDVAVAGAAAVVGRGRYAHIDMQLHRTVVTVLSVEDTVRRESVSRVDRVGLQDVYAKCASAVSDVFIQTQRFDPQAEAHAEQALFDHLPRWLGAIHENASVVLEMEFRGARHSARLERRHLEGVLEPLRARIAATLPADVQVLLADRVARLPGFAAAFGVGDSVDSGDVYESCVAHADKQVSKAGALSFVSRLPAAAAPRMQSRTAIDIPTIGRVASAARSAASGLCVLAGFRALPLGKAPMYLHQSGIAAAHRAADAGSAITWQSSDFTLEPIDGHRVLLNGMPLESGRAIRAGDTVTVVGADQPFRIITVEAADGA